MTTEYHDAYVNGPIGREVAARWGADGIHWSCLGWRGEEKLRWVAARAAETCEDVGNRELTVLEVGTHRGVSSTILADAGFRVITFDIEVYPLRSEVWAHFHVGDRIDARLCSGTADLDRQVQDLAFDLAFIDGCHSYEAVTANFQSLRRCGRVIFHDYEHRLHRDRTVRFVDSIRTGTTVKCAPFALWLSPLATGLPHRFQEARP